MKAVQLYVSTARLVLENNKYSPKICEDLSYSLLKLEQSLCCSVCQNILHDPHSSINISCQHHLCKSCIGKNYECKSIACRCCNSQSKFERNGQLQKLLLCFKALCHYISFSDLLKNVKIPRCFLNDDSQLRKLEDNSFAHEDEPLNPLYRFPDEDDGAYNDKKPQILKSSPSDLNINRLVNTKKARSRGHFSEDLNMSLDNCCGSSRSNDLDLMTSYSVSFNGTRDRMILKRKRSGSDSLNISKAPSYNMLRSSQKISSISENLRYRNLNSSLEMNHRPTCRCGTSGNQTKAIGKPCSARRCPCYLQNKSCVGCKCKGCTNPHSTGEIKVLEDSKRRDSLGTNMITNIQHCDTNRKNLQNNSTQ